MPADPLFLGLDFGTESVRAVLVRPDGSLTAVAHRHYAHGVIEGRFPATGASLPDGFALQDPSNYLTAATEAIVEALASAGPSSGERVAGIGVDFTACTALPVDPSGRWLGERADFATEPHAFAKLWKHHGAIAEANAINTLARARGESWLSRFGGTTSSEWLHAKWWETLRKAPRVAAAAARFLEAGDFVVEAMTGARVRSACMAGYKGLRAANAAPTPTFFEALDPNFARELPKLAGDLAPPGARIGGLSPAFAKNTGLRAGTSVSAAIIDAHAALPGLGVAEPGTLAIILGTSACHMLLSEREVCVPGIQGVVADGVVPGLFAYEAGQAALGDIYAWVSRTTGRPLDELERGAAAIAPAKSGLLMLDWLHGNRSILVDPELSGLIVGITLATTPSHIYRAAVEATAFGTRAILEAFESSGIAIQTIAVCGGIAEKSPFVLQTFADACGRALRRPDAPEVCGRGAAICGAVASGAFPTIAAAAASLGGHGGREFRPDPTHQRNLDALYQDWRKLHDAFGRGDALMARLRHGGESTQ